ncbi:type II toxin-antitoxin system PemK/MazF family toxin [Brachybacterium tyrofermentans]|uniref:type II toxin-antitoxin system PemK/MazF family toxin n=1 Tax=Brachybacterium tyrofermentans TaxID=47848 RepID=UPI003FD558C4
MSLGSSLSSLLRSAIRSPSVRRSARGLGRAAVRAVRQGRGGGAPGSTRPAEQAPSGGGGEQVLADRDPSGAVAISYAPHADDRPDPGEIVWTWVHYEEDASQGKDRPVLVLAEESAAAGGTDGSGAVLVALMLTSRDRAETDEVITDEHGSTWVDVGTGDWERKGRPSEVRADRLLRIVPATVRREGGRLDEKTFGRVAAAVNDVHGWRS